MDYEKEYKSLVAKIKKAHQFAQTDSTKSVLEDILPQLRESEDEMIRRTLVEYFGPEVQIDLVRGIPIQKIRDWLEKQKEPTPADGWDYADKRMSHPLYLEGFEAGRAVERELSEFEKQKEQKPIPDWMPKFLDELRSKKNYFDWDEHRDFEGHILAIINWIAPDYFKRKEEQKPAECIEDSVKFEEGFKAGRESGLLDGQKYVLNNLDSYGLCKPAEWSEEDERKRNGLIKGLENRMGFGWASDPFSREEYISWLKSLRPQPFWKPSEELMGCLERVMAFKHPEPEDIKGCEELLEQLKKLM